MKRWGLIGALLMCLASVSLPACAQSGDESGVNQQPDDTIRSNQQVTVSGRGTIAASTHRNLAFHVDGKIHEMYVNEGEKVSRGDALAKLDTTALELAFAEAEADLVQVQAALVQAGATKEQAEYNLEKTREPYPEDDIDSAERAVGLADDYLGYAKWMLDHAEEAQEKAEDYLDYVERLPYDSEGFDVAQERIAAAETQLDQAAAAVEQWKFEVSRAESDLTDAEQRLEDMLDGPDEGAVEAAEAQLEAADKALEAAEVQVKVAEQAVTEAQKQLGEATLTAPFGGEVANVYADEGDSILPGTTIIHLIDPTSLQLIARVDELDIVKVKTGQKVMIGVDAMPGTILEGLVAFISPVPREAGVILFESDDEEKDYEVKIDFDTPENSTIRVGMNATAEIIVE